MSTQHVVTSRVHPDLDGLACAVAYAELLGATGHRARFWIAGHPDAEAMHVASLLGIAIDATPPVTADRVVLVDTCGLDGLPDGIDREQVCEVLDHRLPHNAVTLFPAAVICIEPVGAAATLVAERFRAAGLEPTRRSAVALQGAIWSNTLGLASTGTTDRDRASFACLQTIEAPGEAFFRAQFDARRRDILRDLPGAIERERKRFEHATGPYEIAQLEFPGAGDHVAACRGHAAALGRRVMLNVVDPVGPISYLIVPDHEFRAWVAACLGLVFHDEVAESDGALLRKQVVQRLEPSP